MRINEIYINNGIIKNNSLLVVGFSVNSYLLFLDLIMEYSKDILNIKNKDKIFYGISSQILKKAKSNNLNLLQTIDLFSEQIRSLGYGTYEKIIVRDNYIRLVIRNTLLLKYNALGFENLSLENVSKTNSSLIRCFFELLFKKK